MQRPRRVAGQEEHGQQIEEAAQVARHAVFRLAEPPGVMAHGYLGHAIAQSMRQHRHVAMQIAIESNALDAVAAVDFEAAVHVVQAQPGHDGGGAVGDA